MAEAHSLDYKNFLKWLLWLSSSLTVMSGAIIAPALPAIEKHFSEASVDAFWIKLVLTMPAFFIATLAPLAGKLCDRWGRRPVLLLGLCIYGLAGLAGFWIDHITWLLVSRAFLGMGVAAIMNASTALAGDYFSGMERNRFLGVQSSFMALGGVIYVNLGGILSDLDWRNPFLVYGLGLVLIPFAMVFLKEVY